MPVERDDYYSRTVNRLEPDIHMIDPGAFYASAAISLKRIADAMERQNELYQGKSTMLSDTPRCWLVERDGFLWGMFSSVDHAVSSLGVAGKGARVVPLYAERKHI